MHRCATVRHGFCSLLTGPGWGRDTAACVPGGEPRVGGSGEAVFTSALAEGGGRRNFTRTGRIPHLFRTRIGAFVDHLGKGRGYRHFFQLELDRLEALSIATFAVGCARRGRAKRPGPRDRAGGSAEEECRRRWRTVGCTQPLDTQGDASETQGVAVGLGCCGLSGRKGDRAARNALEFGPGRAWDGLDHGEGEFSPVGPRDYGGGLVALSSFPLSISVLLYSVPASHRTGFMTASKMRLF